MLTFRSPLLRPLLETSQTCPRQLLRQAGAAEHRRLPQGSHGDLGPRRG